MNHKLDQNESFLSSISDALKSLPETLHEAFRIARKKVMDQTLLNLIEISDVDQQLGYNQKAMKLMELLRIKSEDIIGDLQSNFNVWITDRLDENHNKTYRVDIISPTANLRDDDVFKMPKDERDKFTTTEFFTDNTDTFDNLLMIRTHQGKMTNKNYIPMNLVREFWHFLCGNPGRFCFMDFARASEKSLEKNVDKYVGGQKIPQMKTYQSRSILNFCIKNKLIEKLHWTRFIDDNRKKIGKHRPRYNYKIIDMNKDAIESVISSLTCILEQSMLGDTIMHPHVGLANSELIVRN